MESVAEWKRKIIGLISEDKIQEAAIFLKRPNSVEGKNDEIAKFLVNTGLVLGREKGKHEEALLAFDAAIKLAKNKTIKEKAVANCSVAHSILGNICGKKEEFDKAEIHFVEALRLNPKLPIAHSEYGYLLCLLKRYEEAEDHYKKGLKLNPNNAQAHINYAIVLGNLKKHREAAFHCEEALRLDPKNPKYQTVYGIALMNCKRPNEAESCFREALKTEPDLEAANFGYGKLLASLKRFSEAKPFLKKTFQLNPDFPEVKENYDYTVLMEVSANPRKRITEEWLNVRRRSLEHERQSDLHDFERQKKHEREWKNLYENFECLRCGRCCRRTRWITNIDTRLVWEDIERWGEEGRTDILRHVYVFDGIGGDIFDTENYRRFSKCPFLMKEGKVFSCSIHETKPFVCRIFPFYFDSQGICENCGATVSDEDVFCDKCHLFLKASPGAYYCPGMRKTLKSLGLYKKVYNPILDLFSSAFRKG